MTSQQAAAESDVAVAEPPVVRPQRKKKTDPKKTPPRNAPRYHVILWNDDDHTYEYVIDMMQKLFGHPREKGFLIAEEVDKQGKAICFTTALEVAELKRDQIHAYGPDKGIARCKGSMSATIEADAS